MYFIIEIQANKTGEQAAIAPIPSYTDRDKAVSAFYYKLVYASDPDLSKVEKHTVMLIDHLGQTLMHNVFEHEFPEPEPAPEPEEDEQIEPVVEEPEPEEDDPVEPVEEPAEEPEQEEPSEPQAEEPEAEEVPQPDIDEPEEEPAIDEPVEYEPEGEGEEP